MPSCRDPYKTVAVTSRRRPVIATPRRCAGSCADSDTTIQALLAEALNDLFPEHRLPEIVERE